MHAQILKTQFSHFTFAVHMYAKTVLLDSFAFFNVLIFFFFYTWNRHTEIFSFLFLVILPGK